MLGFHSFSSSEHTGYRFGFNGMEKDDEIKGNGNSLDFGARIYDPRIGRWFSIDKLIAKYPGQSPYGFVNNNPVIYQDFDGNDYALTITKSQNGNKIVISATYYTDIPGSESQNEAVASTEFWNNQTGKFQYDVLENDGSTTTYDVVFDFKVVETEFLDKSDLAFEDKSGNTFDVVPDANVQGGGLGGTAGGEYVQVGKSSVSTDTGPHEMGHTLNLGHFPDGIMKEIDMKRTIQRDPAPTIENIQQMLDVGFGNRKDHSATMPSTPDNYAEVEVNNPDNVKTEGNIRQVK